MRKFSGKRGGFGAAVAVVAIVAGASGVAHADYPPEPDPAITPASSTQVAGASFDETVTGCVPPETVRFTFEGQTVDAPCTNGVLEAVSGSAVASLVAPGLVGTYYGNAHLQTTDVNLPFEVIVEGATGTPGLPATGSDSNQVIPIAIGLMIAGVALVGVAAGRRRHVTG